MKVAVIGAGLAGLAVSCFLLDRPGVEVTLFDPKGIGGGASGASTGLLHPFCARLAIKSWLADEAMQEALFLLDRAEAALQCKAAVRSGILRLAMTKAQQEVFRVRAQTHQEVLWLEPDEVQEKAPHAKAYPGLWIASGVTLFPKLYLQGLFLHCKTRGMKFEPHKIESLDALSHFDQIILCTGFDVQQFPLCSSFILEPTKGYALRCKCNEKGLPFSLIASGHISVAEEPNTCLVGSTYEHNFQDLSADPKAIQELIGKVQTFYPNAGSFEILEVMIGARTSIPKGYRPIAERISERVSLFTGLGSRGHLYHGLLGKRMAEICFDSTLENGYDR